MRSCISAERPIIQCTAGRRHGPITRLFSPEDLGELIKPFVFLDLISIPAGANLGAGFGWHPHSGIATVIVAFKGGGWYADSTGEAGDFQAGGVEWMQAGGGVWHTGGPSAADAAGTGILGFQLWRPCLKRWRTRNQKASTSRPAWLAVAAGRVEVSGVRLETEAAVFAPSAAAINVEALEPTQFVLCAAVPHPHRLVLGYYTPFTPPRPRWNGVRRAFVL